MDSYTKKHRITKQSLQKTKSQSGHGKNQDDDGHNKNCIQKQNHTQEKYLQEVPGSPGHEKPEFKHNLI